MTTSSTHLALWAKTDRDHPENLAYHPLICHLIDVAVVTRELWDTFLTDALRGRIADGLVTDVAAARAWVILLAGLHDIGKATPGFQAKDDRQRARLERAGLRPSDARLDPGHGTVSSWLIEGLLRAAPFGMPKSAAGRLASVSGGHHGRFPEPRTPTPTPVGDPVSFGDATWTAVRADLVTALRETLALDALPSVDRCSHATAMVVAGLISVADWIGSDSHRDRFVFADPAALAGGGALHAYARDAAITAQRVLGDLGWLGWDELAEVRPFDMLFGFQPRPLQKEIVGLSGILDGPGVVVVEVPMGEGKTEAAFLLADRWAHRDARGVYVAMPTMATSNGMFGRLRSFLERRYSADTRVPIELIHSQAAISPELEALRGDVPRLPVTPDDVAQEPGLHGARAEVVVAEWFSRRKRGLLAPWGVGTVDQALLAALRVPHVFVRAFGLAGKTVIFDEVHAYDTYMTTLFGKLLEWLGALGCGVIVLSATLPVGRRDELLRCWARGAGIEIDTIPLACYPRISWVTGGVVGARTVAVSDTAQRTLRLVWRDVRVPDRGNPFPLADALAAALVDGGCVAVICNTVRRAQQMYAALQQHFADFDDLELDLLHARFPFEERDAREKRALARFGKPGGSVTIEGAGEQPVERPAKAVLIATQLIEQSLDLDFDLMVSDLAPADLVLQRSGRLQRHDRDRPERFRSGPELWIGLPDSTQDDVPRFDAGSEAIYDEHVLLRSWLALKDRRAIAIPDEVEALIEATYGDAATPPADGTVLRAAWDSTSEILAKKRHDDSTEAKRKWIPSPDSDSTLTEMTRSELREDAPEKHADFQALTRLGPPSITVVCLWRTADGLTTDRERRQPIDPEVVKDLAVVRRLLRRAVTVTHRGAFHALVALEPPASWRESALLRHHRLLCFDADGHAWVSVPERSLRFQLTLHPKLGLLIDEE